MASSLGPSLAGMRWVSSVRGRDARPDAARVAGVAGEVLESSDLPLALLPHGVVVVQALDQPLDPVPDLKRGMGSRRSGEGADVLDGGPMALRNPVRAFGSAHGC